MPRTSIAALFIAASLVTGQPARAEPRTYQLIPGKCSLVVQLFKDGAGARFAHDHVIQARKLSGAITVDPEALGVTSIRITVDARSLDPDAATLRKKYGLPGHLSPGDRSKVAANMRAEDQLNVARYPSITFRSTGVAALKAPGRYTVTGKLTLRGVTREVSLAVKAKLVGGVLKGGGQLRIKQSDFGYKPYSAGLGLVKVKDGATINIYLEAKLASY